MSVEAGRALSHACRLLSYRQRSERELETRLRKKGFGKGAVCEAIGSLKSGGYLDDLRYAMDLRRTAEDVKFLGAYGARRFLIERGIQAGTAEEALAGYDERAVAARLMEKKLVSMKALSRPARRRRLSGYMQRRGYSAETAARILREYLEEANA